MTKINETTQHADGVRYVYAGNSEQWWMGKSDMPKEIFWKHSFFIFINELPEEIECVFVDYTKNFGEVTNHTDTFWNKNNKLPYTMHE